MRLTTQIEHDLIWGRRLPFVLDGQPTHVMAAEDMLLHLAVHTAINHHFAAHHLRALLDVHLLVQKLEPDWEVVVRRACRWRIATVTWIVLSLTQHFFGTGVPASVLATLAPSPLRQRAIRALRLERALEKMWPVGYTHRRFLIQTLLIDRPQDMVRLYAHTLFPEQEWLEARYGVTEPRALWRERVLHPLRVLFRAQV